MAHKSHVAVSIMKDASNREHAKTACGMTLAYWSGGTTFALPGTESCSRCSESRRLGNSVAAQLAAMQTKLDPKLARAWAAIGLARAENEVLDRQQRLAWSKEEQVKAQRLFDSLSKEG